MIANSRSVSVWARSIGNHPEKYIISIHAKVRVLRFAFVLYNGTALFPIQDP
jgi:hypothetical protein